MFEIIGSIGEVKTIATGREIRELRRLKKAYGVGLWHKRKGVATLSLHDGSHRRAEIHWYEAHGIGRKEIKIKRFLP